jgi:uncharacterized protein YndB with AHSA1/START domain
MSEHERPARRPVRDPKDVGISTPSETELVAVRELDAPPHLVWEAWSDATRLARWWGPTGFTTSTKAFRFEPRGSWRFTMHGPDGHDYENLITYQEIDRPRRIVYTHGGEKGLEPVSFTVHVTFDPIGPDGSRTRLTLRSIFPSRQQRDFVIKQYGADEGARQTLTRLAEFIEPGSPEDVFEIARVFRSPRERVWEAWTRREHLGRWFGPKGSKLAVRHLDLKPGGTFHYEISMNDAMHWGLWTFRDIVPPERLVFSIGFADEHARPARHPWNKDWPMEMLSTVTFEPHAGIGGGTVVRIRWEPIHALDLERRTFREGRPSMQQGWTGTLDNLEAFLSTGGD